MSVPLYMDHHVHTAITEGLQKRGIDVITASEDGAADWDDERLLQRATDLQRVLFTQDRDFLVLAHQWQKSSREFAGVVYGHQLSVTIGQAMNDLELIATICEPDELHNRIEFLPL